MNTLTLDTPISEFVTANPESARVFEQLGLDYCCGGKKPLWEACKEKGLDPEAVFHDLVAEAGEPAAGSWQRPAARSLSALAVEIIETHHTYLRHEIPRITALLERVVRRHGDRHPELKLIQETFAGFASDLCEHMLKEEGILFPAIRQIEAGGGLETFPIVSIKDPIQALEKEHGDAGRALERMRELSRGFVPPDDACESYRVLFSELADMEKDMHLHVHKENNILFPKAIKAERLARRWNEHSHQIQD